MRRVLHQCVLEAVDRMRRHASLEHQLGDDQTGERSLQLMRGRPLSRRRGAGRGRESHKKFGINPVHHLIDV